MANALYFGNNLEVLRESIKDESVDMVYLDPPFNSNANYKVFKSAKGHDSGAQIEAFDDTWDWGVHAETAFADVMQGFNTDVSEVMRKMSATACSSPLTTYP